MRRLIERGDNVNEQNEDALFDQLEKSLGTIRQNAALARFVGAEGISGDVARAEAEVRRLATCIEALCQRAEQQHAVTTRLEIAAAKVETHLLGLRQAVEALSFPARGQTQIPARTSARSTTRWPRRRMRRRSASPTARRWWRAGTSSSCAGSSKGRS